MCIIMSLENRDNVSVSTHNVVQVSCALKIWKVFVDHHVTIQVLIKRFLYLLPVFSLAGLEFILSSHSIGF